jgi:hypothetical protein
MSLTPRQQDIYSQMREENILMPDGKSVTPQWVQENYPSTLIQPRCKKKSKIKIKRKIKQRGKS